MHDKANTANDPSWELPTTNNGIPTLHVFPIGLPLFKSNYMEYNAPTAYMSNVSSIVV